MMKLQVNLIRSGCADGKYIVKAKRYILAVLSWGNERAPLHDWGAFAYVPIDPNGNGSFCFEGGRGIPRGATHVYAHCIAADFFSHEDICAEIPAKFLDAHDDSDRAKRFSVLTDLHLASKPWRITRALRAAKSDVIFLLGDCVNDGTASQFAQFEQCLKDSVQDKIVLPVIGNHDVLHDSDDGCKNYAEFQRHILENQNLAVAYDTDSLAYSVQMDDIDIVGLQCVISGRKFSFPEGRQIAWLSEHLRAHNDSLRHIILCHAPLLAHNPNRSTGNPYLGRNKMLQELIDSHTNIIFLSGHTHISPNGLRGNGEHDKARNNIYIDCGSVVDTDISGTRELMSPDWNDGCITELAVSKREVEVCISSINTGLHFPRGYYRFHK